MIPKSFEVHFISSKPHSTREYLEPPISWVRFRLANTLTGEQQILEGLLNGMESHGRLLNMIKADHPAIVTIEPEHIGPDGDWKAIVINEALSQFAG